MQDFALLKVFYNGAPITMITRIKRLVNANNIPIMVMSEGLVGYTDGSGECTMDWDAPIPIGGTEFDYEGDCTSKNFVDMQIFVGRRSYAGRGKLVQAETSQETQATATIAVSWQGEFKPTAS